MKDKVKIISKNGTEKLVAASVFKKSDKEKAPPMALDINSRVLIIDDSLTVRESLKMTLSASGLASYDVAASCHEARAKMRAREFDIILCDYHLGDGKESGQQFLESLRKNNQLSLKTIFFMITAENSYENVVATAEIAPDDYLLKPFTPDSLLNRLEKIARKKKTLSSLYDLIENRKVEEAIQYCHNYLEDHSNPFKLDVVRLLSELYITQQQYDLAGKLYEKLLSEKTVPWAKIGLARILSRREKYDDSEKILNELIEESPMYLDAYDHLVHVYTQKGRMEEAFSMLTKAVDLSPKNINRLQEAGKLAMKIGKKDEANQLFEKAFTTGKFAETLETNTLLHLMYSQISNGKLENLNKITKEIKNNIKSYENEHFILELVTVMKAIAEKKMEVAFAHLGNASSMLRDNGISFDLVNLFISLSLYCYKESEFKTEVKKWLYIISKRFAYSKKELDEIISYLENENDLIAMVNDGYGSIINENNVGMKMAAEGRLEESVNYFLDAAEDSRNDRTLLNTANVILKMVRQTADKKYLIFVEDLLDKVVNPLNKDRVEHARNQYFELKSR